MRALHLTPPHRRPRSAQQKHGWRSPSCERTFGYRLRLYLRQECAERRRGTRKRRRLHLSVSKVGLKRAQGASLQPSVAHVRRAERAPQEKRPCNQRASGTARPPRGRSAHGRRDGADAAQAVARGDGRYSDRAHRPASADGRDTLRRTGKRGRRGGHAGTRCAPVPTVAENGPEAERPSRRGAAPRCDRARTQSHDCGEARAGSGTPPAGGEARSGRSPPHADRHSKEISG